MPSPYYPESQSYYMNVTQQWLEGIRREVPAVTSSDAAFTWGREAGLTAPRWAWRDAWRADVRGKGYREIYQRFNEEEIIPRSWMESTEYRYKVPYIYIVNKGTLIDEEGVSTQAMVTILADVSLSIGEILEEAASIAWGCWPTLDPFAYIPIIEHVYYKPERLLFP